MENNKKKYTLEIAGMPMTIVTDEPASFVESIITRLNERIAEMTAGSYRISTLDAALLCSIDYLGDKLKAEKRIRNLEAQVSLYEDNIKRLREELDETKAQLANQSAEETAPEETELTILEGEGTKAYVPVKELERQAERAAAGEDADNKKKSLFGKNKD